MTDSRLVTALATRRWWLYAGGLAALLVVRASPVPRPVRLGVTALVLGVMVLTYAAERLVASDGPVHRGLALFGFAGVALGLALTVAGRFAGFAFVAGGLLFLHRAIGEAPP